VTTRLEEAGLRRLAFATGGAYVRWADDASVRPLAIEISRLKRRPDSSLTSRPGADRFQWPLGLALVALVGQTLVRGRRDRRGRRRQP